MLFYIHFSGLFIDIVFEF